MNRNEWVIHIWGKRRDGLNLTNVEKFHLHMIKLFELHQRDFDKILINIAMDDFYDDDLFDFLKKECENVIVNKNCEIRRCKNDPQLGEYVTFRSFVFDRIGEDVNIFYSHFKGYGSCVGLSRESYPSRIIDLNELYWAYLMYMYSMDLVDVRKNIEYKCIYCWFFLKMEFDKMDKVFDGYYIKYQNELYKINGMEECADKKYAKLTPGSFCWYNMKNIGKELKYKKVVTSVTKDELYPNLLTHFCELYLMRFIPNDMIYSPNTDNEELIKYRNKLYEGIYTYKKIGREYLNGFENFLIKNKMI